MFIVFISLVIFTYLYHDARFRECKKENLNVLLNTTSQQNVTNFVLKNSSNFCTFVFSFAGLGT